MNKIPETIFIQDKNFHSAWSRLIRENILNGTDLTIGNNQKQIRDICALTELTGKAIEQILDYEIHPQFPFSYIAEYCEEFTYKYQYKYIKKLAIEQFSYTYFDRFTNYDNNINQLDELRLNLEDQIYNDTPSNQNQMITWNPKIDIKSNSPPCLQNIWVRYIGNENVEVHWHFRSRDLFTAWQANIIALIYMLNEYVINPHECKIVKIVDYCDSLHIYKSDMAEAKKVKLIGNSFQ